MCPGEIVGTSNNATAHRIIMGVTLAVNSFGLMETAGDRSLEMTAVVTDQHGREIKADSRSELLREPVGGILPQWAGAALNSRCGFIPESLLRGPHLERSGQCVGLPGIAV